MSHAVNAAPQTSLEISISPVREADIGYCLGSWKEAYKLVGANKRMPWGMFKREVMPELAKALLSSTVLAAYAGDQIVGWASANKTRRVPACHWVHTRYHVDGVDWRRRGIASALLSALSLGTRCVYTHHSPKPRRLEEGGLHYDAMLVAWLAKRGTYATHIPFKEWF